MSGTASSAGWQRSTDRYWMASATRHGYPSTSMAQARARSAARKAAGLPSFNAGGTPGYVGRHRGKDA